MKSRGERLLNALEAQDASSLLEPITREDMYMNALVTKETDGLPVPVTIEEHYLHAGATNADVSTLRTPITREDVYLHGLSIKDVDALPEPITLEERFIRAAIAFLGAGAEQPEEPVDPPVEEPAEPPFDFLIGKTWVIVDSFLLVTNKDAFFYMNPDGICASDYADIYFSSGSSFLTDVAANSTLTSVTNADSFKRTNKDVYSDINKTSIVFANTESSVDPPVEEPVAPPLPFPFLEGKTWVKTTNYYVVIDPSGYLYKNGDYISASIRCDAYNLEGTKVASSLSANSLVVNISSVSDVLLANQDIYTNRDKEAVYFKANF